MTLTVTPNAAKRILVLIAVEEEPTSALFRITVSGGGCAGFQYGFSLDHAVQEDDQVFEENGVKVVVDEASLPFLEGAEVDYVEELIGSYFLIKNPNASTSCGCGNSFSV